MSDTEYNSGVSAGRIIFDDDICKDHVYNVENDGNLKRQEEVLEKLFQLRNLPGDEFFLDVFDKVSDGIYFADSGKVIRYWSKGAEKITGYKAAEVIGKRCSENILRHIDKHGEELCSGGCPLGRTLSDGRLRVYDAFLHHKDGHNVPVHIRVCPLYDREQRVCGAAEIFSLRFDRAEVIEELELLRREAFIDPLTKMANRRFAEMTLEMKISEWARFKTPLALLFIDIDNFKVFNDKYGHKTGDKIIRMTGKTISNVVRKMDLASRWGGEEFVVIISNTTIENLMIIAEKIRIHIEKDWIEEKGEILKTTVSIGGTMFRPSDTIYSFIDRADLLMYKCKAEGKNKSSIA